MRIPILLFLLTSASVELRPGGDEEKARTEIERADVDLAKGRFAKAFGRLQKVVRRFPDTTAARSAWERTQPNALLGWRDVLRHGPAANRVDVVVMGDGYPLAKQGVFDDHVADLPEIFSRDELFGEYFTYFNFIQAIVPSVETGIDEYGRKSDTALGARLIEGANDNFVSADLSAVQRVLARMDEHDDLALVLVESGLLGTSSRGVATMGARDLGHVLHHFGHAFGGLGDESSDINDFFGGRRDRADRATEVNVSRVEDPERVPWAHWIAAGAPSIGVYEGALGLVRGVWKPRASGCRMEGAGEYCVACREALLLRIYTFVDPVESASLTTSPSLAPGEALTGSERHEFEVTVLQPASHGLEVSWWVLPAAAAPSPRPDLRPRSRLSVLEEITAKPVARTRGKRGVHSFELDPKRLDPGSYRVHCRVRDTTLLRGERFPWVLKDERGLLQSERVWIVEVGS